MSLGLYIAAIMAKDVATLESVLADPKMLAKSAKKYGVREKDAAWYLEREIDAKRAGY